MWSLTVAFNLMWHWFQIGKIHYWFRWKTVAPYVWLILSGKCSVWWRETVFWQWIYPHINAVAWRCCRWSAEWKCNEKRQQPVLQMAAGMEGTCIRVLFQLMVVLVVSWFWSDGWCNLNITVGRRSDEVDEYRHVDITEQKVSKWFNRKWPNFWKRRHTSRCDLAGADMNKNGVQRVRHVYGNRISWLWTMCVDYRQVEQIGKNVGDDLAEGKPTLPLIYLMQQVLLAQRHPHSFAKCRPCLFPTKSINTLPELTLRLNIAWRRLKKRWAKPFIAWNVCQITKLPKPCGKMAELSGGAGRIMANINYVAVFLITLTAVGCVKQQQHADHFRCFIIALIQQISVAYLPFIEKNGGVGIIVLTIGDARSGKIELTQ